MIKNVTPEQFENILSDINSELNTKLELTMKLCCQKVRSDIIKGMNNTTRNYERSYFTNNKKIAHHPSVEGDYPAPDTGRLKASINYDVEGTGYQIVGRVGSTLTDPPYAFYLEFGTIHMAERPWLRPTMSKDNSFIRSQFQKAVKKVLEG